VVSYPEREGVFASSVPERLSPGSGKRMSLNNPVSPPVHKDDLRSDYDFSGGVRGKHYQNYKAGTNVVFLDADVAKASKDSESVNQALLLLLDLAKRQSPPDRAA